MKQEPESGLTFSIVALVISIFSLTFALLVFLKKAGVI